MLKAREFLERGASVVLRNLIMKDTTNYQTERPGYFFNGVDLTNFMKEGHTYYFRVSTRQTVEGFSDVASTATLGASMVLFAHTSNSSTKYYFSWVPSTYDNDGYSGLYTFTGFKEEGEFWVGNPSVYRDAEDIENDPGSKSGSFGLFYKEWMAIDITDLYTMYPSFAGLSTEEQKAVLDEIPFFIGYHKFSYTKDERNYTSFEQNKVRTNELLEGSFWQSLAVDGSEDPFFEGSKALYRYNNSYSSSDESTNTPVLTKVDAPDDFPLKDSHPKVYKLSFDRTKTATPELGGFINSFRPNKVGIFKQVMYLKAPEGLNPLARNNYIVNSIRSFNANTTGTWQEIYIRISVSDKVNLDGGHISFTLNSLAEVPEQFDIYVGASTVLDITDYPELLHTPLFDPSLGARMTSGGALHSEAFIEDSAISSVQVSRGGVRRIPEVVLRNRVTEDTSSIITVTNNGYPAVIFPYDDTTETGKFYYMRARVKYTASEGPEFTQLWLWLKEGNSDAPARITTSSPGMNEEKFFSGVVYTNNATYGQWKRGAVYWGPSPSGDRTMTSEYRHIMCIDLTELYKIFPSFASLSLEDQTDILDGLPYFHGDLKLGGSLENLVSNADNIEGQWVAGEAESYNNRNIKLSQKLDLTKITIYSRYDAKYVKLDSEAKDYDWMSYYWASGTYKSGIIMEPQPDIEYSNVSDFSYIRKLSNYLTEANDGWLHGGNNDNRIGKQMYSRNIICICLNNHGNFTLLRLLGLSGEEIKNYFDSLPFFRGTIPFPTLIDDQKKLY